MTRLAGLLIAVSFSTVASAAADPPPTAETISLLIGQLGAESYADREAASARLAKIGMPALAALQAALRNDNPEVRERAAALVGKIHRADESAKLIVARRVKLSYQNIPLGTALNDLRTRTGLNLVLNPNRISNPLRIITCETEEMPVWEALDAFCAAAGLREIHQADLELPKSTAPRRGYVPPPPPPNAESVRIELMDGPPEHLPGDRATAVRVVALPSKFPGHKVTLGTGELTLCLDVTPTSGLGWEEVIGVKVTRVIDSAGRPGAAGVEKAAPAIWDPSGGVIFARPGMAFRFDNMGNTILPDAQPNPRIVPVPLRLETAAAKSLKRMEGFVFAELNSPNHDLITVIDPKRHTNTPYSGAGDVKFTVLDVKPAAGPGAVGILRVQLEQPSQFAQSARRRGFNPAWNLGFPEAPMPLSKGLSVEIYNAAGKLIQATPGGTGFDTSDDGMMNIYTLQYSLPAGVGVPTKLIVRGPKPIAVQVPFTLENVPLP